MATTDFAVLQDFMSSRGLIPADPAPALDEAELALTLTAAREQHGDVFADWLGRMTREAKGARRFSVVSWRQARMGWGVATKGAEAQAKMHVGTNFEEYYAKEEIVEYLKPKVTPDGNKVFVKLKVPKSVAEHMAKEDEREARERAWQHAQAIMNKPSALASVKLLDESLSDVERIDAARLLNADEEFRALADTSTLELIQRVVDKEISPDEMVRLSSQVLPDVDERVQPILTSQTVFRILSKGLSKAKTSEDTDAAIEAARNTDLLDDKAIADAVASTARVVGAKTGTWVVQTSDPRAVTLFAQRCNLDPEAADAVVDEAVVKYLEAMALLSGAGAQASHGAVAQVAHSYANVLAGLSGRGLLKPECRGWQMLLDSCDGNGPIPYDLATEVLLMSPLVDEALLLKMAASLHESPWARTLVMHKNSTIAVWRLLVDGNVGPEVWATLATRPEARKDPAIRSHMEEFSKGETEDATLVAAHLLVDKTHEEFMNGFAEVAGRKKGPKALSLALEQAPRAYLEGLTPELLDPFIFDSEVEVRTFAQQILLIGVTDNRYHETMKVEPAQRDFPKTPKPVA